MPPQKLASKIAELSGKIFTKNIFLIFDIISRTRLYWDFSKKSGVSLIGIVVVICMGPRTESYTTNVTTDSLLLLEKIDTAPVLFATDQLRCLVAV